MRQIDVAKELRTCTLDCIVTLKTQHNALIVMYQAFVAWVHETIREFTPNFLLSIPYKASASECNHRDSPPDFFAEHTI